jgi:hypothetical protein
MPRYERIELRQFYLRPRSDCGMFRKSCRKMWALFQFN